MPTWPNNSEPVTSHQEIEGTAQSHLPQVYIHNNRTVTTSAHAVADERASSSRVCASERRCATFTVPYRMFDIRS